MFYFAETHGIVGIEAGNDAHRGTELHDLLKRVPYFSKRLQYGSPFNIGERIQQSATEIEMKLKTGDFWFCFNAIRRRNLLIDDHLARVHDECGGISSVSIDYDARRLHQVITVEDDAGGTIEVPFSGLPDVLIAVTDNSSRKHVLVVDYKTGFAPQQDGKVNRQLASLAALSAWEDPLVDSVGVSLTARNDEKADEISLVLFGQEELAQAKALVGSTVAEVAKLRADYEDHRDATRDDTPPPSIETRLQEKSSVGDHCGHFDVLPVLKGRDSCKR